VVEARTGVDEAGGEPWWTDPVPSRRDGEDEAP
jgi:hypothetical protein